MGRRQRALNSDRAKLRVARQWAMIFRVLAFAMIPALCLLAGCGGGTVAANPSHGTFSITPGTASIDTNCSGCNAANSPGASVEQFTAKLASGDAATVTWEVSGGGANSGAGTIAASGQYTPPSYLPADS